MIFITIRLKIWWLQKGKVRFPPNFTLKISIPAKTAVQHVDGADGVGLDRLVHVHRVVHVMRRGGQVIDLINLDEERLDDVVVAELKVLLANPVLDVPFLAGEEIVNA